MKLIFLFIAFFGISSYSISQDYLSPNYPYPEFPSDIEKDSMDWNRRNRFKIIYKHFGSCSEIRTPIEKLSCSKEKMQKFIKSNLIYPDSAWVNNIEGIVIVEFIVEKDGSISNIKLIHDIGYGCGEEALRIVSKMPRFEPGRSRGSPRYVLQVAIEFYKYDYYLKNARLDIYQNDRN